MSPRKKSSFKLSRRPNNSATDVTLASTEFAKRKKVETRVAETQTTPERKSESIAETQTTSENKAESDQRTITVEDLTTDGKPSPFYYERLAEKRREVLEEALAENQCLHERIESLESELNTSRQMLEEARNLVEVLTEMLNENEAEREIESEEAAGVTALAGGEDDNSSDTKSSEHTGVVEVVKTVEEPQTP